MSKLTGEFHHKLDAKGRVSLPSSFRKLLSKNLKVTQAPQEKCLFVFEPEAFDAWVDSIFESQGNYAANDMNHVMGRRLLNARAAEVEVDNAGRIGISADLRSKADLAKEVVIIGNGDRIEIWDAKRWDDIVNGYDFNSLFVNGS